jgi:O-antigen/teichoic acid export membrane protein
LFKKNLSIVFIGGFSRSVFLIIQGFLLAKFLGARSYGIFSLAFSYVALVFGFIDFKIAEAVIKFVSELKLKNEKEPIYIVSLFFVAVEIAKGLVSSLLILLTSWLAAAYIYKKPYLFGFILVLSLSNLFLSVNPTVSAYLRLGGHFKLIAWYDFFFGLFSLLAIGLVAYLKRSLWPVVIAQAAVGLVGGIAKNLTFAWAFRAQLKFKEIFRAARNWRSFSLPWKRIVHFALYLNITSTFRYFTKNLDVLILGKFVSLEGVGAYSLARRIGNLFGFFTDPLLIVIYPEMAKAWAARQFGKVKSLFKKITYASASLTLLFYSFLGFSSTWLIPKLFGKDFSKSVTVLWLFMPGVIFAVGFFAIYHLMLTIGATKVVFWSSLIQMLTMVALVPLMSYLWKENGAALAMSVATILSHLYSLYGVRKYFLLRATCPA